MNHKRILLGVSGGIAAYKSAELTRLLRRQGAEVRIVMTQAALSFITPLSLQALSGNPVHCDLLDAQTESAMGHIELARWADQIIVAPATADFIAKLSLGLANDLLSALCLASAAPIALAPAMNHVMWQNPATQENIARLVQRGVRILGPAEGEQACGETGLGRMQEPLDICQALEGLFNQGPLAGVSVLISAGPTREPIDPVRFIGNRSSGKMGFALAEAASLAGARVTLVSGPVSMATPKGVTRFDVETAADMYDCVLEHVKDCDIYIGAAAVADYTPSNSTAKKIKKSAENLVLNLTKTRDILSAVAMHEHRPFTVGFAAETDNLEAYALKKLNEKRLDMIAANRVGQSQGGFESEENALHVFWSDSAMLLPMRKKSKLAIQLIDLIAERYHAKDS